jgi:hypothetical protein
VGTEVESFRAKTRLARSLLKNASQ